MSTLNIEELRNVLLAAGFEIYRTTADELLLAERIRYHMMDSGVSLRLGADLRISFKARSQQSDFPDLEPEQLFEKVATAVGGDATARGYEEVLREVVDVRDPVDESRVLDIWHELRFEKAIESLEDVIDEARWALSIEKYVSE